MPPLKINVDTLFCEAIAIEDPSARQAFIERSSGSNSHLYQHLEKLVAAHFLAGEFLERPLGPVTPVLPEDDLDPAATVLNLSALGSLVGPYKIRELLGEGGMGSVFVAEQDKPVRRKVALKLIKPGMDNREVLARFEMERQALAMMDHPHIAQVLDTGTTDLGRPYFAMELVKGLPITEHCDTHQFDLRARLRLFLQVCQAVQHAHQKGVIHRDLKPSNILVAVHDTTPVVKVIDFGVAKALGYKLVDQTVYTGVNQWLGTPLYMSPEQAQHSSLDIDTRSDVYSLGVLLYELLTGTTPFRKEVLSSSGFEELRRLIHQQDPPRPSARLTTLSALARSTVADRRRIDPRRISDLVRGELDWIVMKALQKDRTLRYESASALAADVTRYLNREPVQARAPSVGYRLSKFVQRQKAPLLAGFLVFAAAITVLAVALSGHWESQRRVSAAVRAVMSSLASANTAIEARNLELAKQILAAARARLEFAGSLRGELAGQIAVVQGEIERAQADVQNFADFVELARAAQQTLSRTEKQEGAIDARQALDCYGVIEQRDWTDSLQKSQLSEQQREQVVETAYETLLLLADSRVRSPVFQNDTAAHEGLELLDVALRFHQPTKALYWVRQELHRYLKDDEAADRDLAQFDATPARTAWDWYLPGHTAAWRGDLKAAIAAYEHALRIEPDHYNSLFFLGRRLAADNRHAEALGYFAACIALRPDPLSYWSRALAHLELGHSAAAEADFKWALMHMTNPLEKARLLCELGRALTDQYKLDEAIECYRKAIELEPKLAVAHQDLSAALMNQGKLDEAIECCRRAIELEPKYAVAHNNLGAGLLEQGKLDEAIECCRKAIELEPKYAIAHLNLGTGLTRQKKLDEAIECYRMAIELDPKLAAAYSHLAWLQATSPNWCLRDARAAVAFARRAVELDPKSASYFFNLGVTLYRTEDYLGAIESLEKAREMRGNKDPVHQFFLAMAYWAAGRQDDALTEYIAAVQALHAAPRSAEQVRFRDEAETLIGGDRLIAFLSDAIAAQPDAIQAASLYEARGAAHAMLGNLDQAAADYAQALQQVGAERWGQRPTLLGRLIAGDAQVVRKTIERMPEPERLRQALAEAHPAPEQ